MISCNVFKDLLPSYIEGLVSEETAKEVAEHLANCNDCQKIHTQMKTKLPPIKGQDKKEINYLKKIISKIKLKALIIGAVVLSVIIVLYVCLFTKGSHLASTDVSYKTIMGNTNLMMLEMSIEKGFGYALSVRSEYDFYSRTGKMDEVILTPRKVVNLIPNTLDNQYFYGFSTDSDITDEFKIVIRFSDKEIILTTDDFYQQ